MLLQQDMNYAVLNEEEINRLFTLCKRGDECAREKLILHNIRLTIFIAKRFENANIDIEELVSIGTVGLIKAVDTYELDKETKFATYSARCIQNEILMYLRNTRKYNNEISMQSTFYTDENGNELTYENILVDTNPTAEDHVVEICENEILNDILYNLTEREQEIIKLHYGFYNGRVYSQEEIAAMFEVSQSYISRIIRNTIPKIKKKYLEYIS